MNMPNHAALMGSSAIISVARGRAPECKDNPADLSVEVKKAVEDLMKGFEEFKTKNDERIRQVEKGREDVVTREQVEKINKSLDELQDRVKKRVDEIEAKANRMALGGVGGDVETKAAAEFSTLVSSYAPDRKAAVVTPEQMREYKTALGDVLRNPERKAVTLQVGVDPAGGYWVTPDTSGRMVKKIYESSPMRQLATVVTIGSDALEGPIDNGEFDAAWINEIGARSQTDASQIGIWRIPVNELYAFPKVTQKLLDDATIDIEGWVAGKATEKFARKETAAYVNGDGNLKPKGLMQYSVASTADATRTWGVIQYVVSGASGAFASSNPADKLIDLVYALKAGYRQNAAFFMARATVAAARKLKDGQGNYLWQPAATAGQPSSLLGYRIVEGEDMPALAADSLSIAFGDFAEAYTIVDRLGISVVRDNVTQAGFVKYHMRRRTGGGLINSEAVKFLKFGTS